MASYTNKRTGKKAVRPTAGGCNSLKFNGKNTVIVYILAPFRSSLYKTDQPMRSLFQLLAAGLAVSAVVACNQAPRPTAQDLGWKVGIQSWTFRNFTFFQAVDKTKSLGLHYIEAYPGQKIGGDVQGTMVYGMDSSTRQKVLDYLKQQDVKLMSYGVIVPDSLHQW